MNKTPNTPTNTSTPTDLVADIGASRGRRFRRTSRVLAASALVVASLGLGPTAAGAIVNGTPSGTSDNPWQVSIQDAEGHACGGSIISATQVVTAAHCFLDGGEGLSVVAGSDTLSANDGQRVEVASLVNHPEYAETEVADVAVITLASPLTLNNNVQPIALANAAEIAAARTATVTGWGSVSEEGDGSDRLLSAEVPLVDDASCSARLSSGSTIDDDAEVCAGGEGKDSCYGDSGGPLTITTNDGPKLAGIVSWGEECAGASPGIYTEVPTFSEFITSGGTEGTDFTAEDPDVRVGFDDFDDEYYDDEYFDGEYYDGEYYDGEDDELTWDLDDEYFDDEYYDEEAGDTWDDSDWDDSDWEDCDLGEWEDHEAAA